MSLPTITTVANLTADPELRFTGAGKAVAKIGVACNRNRKTDQGYETTHTVFLTVQLWEADAETAAEHLRKGDRVLVTGELVVDEWEGKDGSKRQTLVVDRATIAKALPRQSRPQGFTPQRQPTQQAWATDTQAPF